MKCKDCKHWKNIEQSRYGDMSIGTCYSPKFKYSYDIEPRDFDSIAGDELLYYDFEQYGATIRPLENFGCVHFEAK